MKNLILLGSDPDKQLRLIEIVSPDWETAGHLLGMSIGRIGIIREDNRGRSVENCCRQVMSHWLYDDNAAYSYPKSWEGMCRLLSDMKLSRTARDLRRLIFPDH